MSTPATIDDATYAESLARQEQEQRDAALARQLQSSSQSNSIVCGQRSNCPGQHGLHPFMNTNQLLQCDICRTSPRGQAHGCIDCDYHVCDRCYRGTTTAPPRAQHASSAPLPSHNTMCVVPCVFHPPQQKEGSGLCMELMIDTGAATSVMSTAVAEQLGLVGQVDGRYQGMAAGVGRARILGKIHQVPVELGHVEFPLDFLVLENSDQLLLLGLDLMRKYKCIVDLERKTLVFGGKGGVEVEMLPADEQQVRARSSLNGCPTM